MSEFRLGTLGNIAKGKRGVSYKPEDVICNDNEVHKCLLTAGNIQAGTTNIDTFTKVSPSCVSEDQLIDPDEILVCMSNGSKRLVGKSSRLRSANSRQFCVGAFCSTFRPSNSADADFVFHIFQSDLFKRQVSDAIEGSAINNLKNSTIEEFQVPIPPLPEQKKIAKILSKMDDCIHALSQKIAKKRLLMNAVTSEMFDKIISESGTGKIGDVSALTTKGTTPTSVGLTFVPSGVAFVKAQSIGDFGELIRDNFSYISEDAHQKLSRSILQENDVLITIAGTIGRCSVVPESILPANTNQAVAIVRLNSDRMLPSFLSAWIRSDRCQAHFASLQTIGAQPNVSLQQISDTPVPLATIESQLHFVSVYSAFCSSLNNLMLQRDRYSFAKQSLSAELLTGLKRVSV